MSEWLKEHAWKACVGETLPRVRIPLSPPISCQRQTRLTITALVPADVRVSELDFLEDSRLGLSYAPSETCVAFSLFASPAAACCRAAPDRPLSRPARRQSLACSSTLETHSSARSFNFKTAS